MPGNPFVNETSDGKTYRRADGEAICFGCGLVFRKHPTVDAIEANTGEVMQLRRLCDGGLVKL